MLTILVLCALLCLVAAVLGYLIIFSGADTISDGSQPTKTRNIKPTPSTPNLVVVFSLCLLLVIRAPFRWWAKHPWMVFWGTFPLYFVIRDSLGWFTTPYSVFLLSSTILILSFIQGIFLIWLRSGIGAVLNNVAVPILFVGIIAVMALPQFRPYARAENDSAVKSNLKRAANAEEAYYKVNGTYTANIGNLKGFNQSDNVTIAVEATTTTYVIIGTATKRCEANSGVWLIDSTTGAINGTPCRLTRYGLTSFILEGNWP